MIKKIFFSLGILFLAISQSAFAGDTIIESKYVDQDQDGIVDHILWTFDENITQCTFDSDDWVYNNYGTIAGPGGSFSVTGSTCSGPVLTLEITGAAANITGGVSDPVIGYRQNNGTANSIMLDSGNLTDKSNVNVGDGAAPVVVSFTLALNASNEVHVDEESSKDATHGVVDVLLTEDIVGMTNPGADNGAFSVWGSDNHMYFEFRDRDDGNPRPDVDIPSDANGDGTYELEYNFMDSAMNQSQLALFKIVLGNVNEAPVPVSGFGHVLVNENQTAVSTVMATDPEGVAITYSIIDLPGAPMDSLYFDIDSITGVITFKNAPDFENPLDTAGIGEPAADNNYFITIKSSDGVNNINSFLNITVQNIDEATGHSGKSHKGSSAKKVCKDSKAINFNNIGQHDASLCKYAEEKSENVKEKKEEKAGEQVEEQGEKVQRKCSIVVEEKGFLRVGSKGQAVKDLQEFLNDNGFNAGKVDGIFGKLTRAAVKRMQTKLGVSPDGVVGPQTRGNISCE